MRFGLKTAAIGLLGGVLGLGVPVSASIPSTDPIIRQAADLVEWGRWKDARGLLANATADPRNAHNAALLAYYSHVLVKFGSLRQGMILARRAVVMDRDCSSCHLYLFEAMAQQAKGYSQLRALLQLPLLKKQLEKAEKLDPASGDVQWGWIDLDLALPPVAGGSIPDAVAHAEKLMQTDPVDGHLARATIALARGRSERALDEYRAAVAEHPDDPRGLYALGQALFTQDDYAAAEPYLERALKLQPASALYSAYQAADLVRLKRLAEARSVIATGQREHPDSRLDEYLAAAALRDTGQDFAWARQLLDDYLAAPPEPDQPTTDDARNLLAQLG